MRTHKLSVLVAVLVAMIVSTFTTKVVAEEKTWSVSLSSDFVSKYVGFGNGGVFDKDPMFQTCLVFSHKSGFHADIWWGTGLDDNLVGSGFDDELDYNVGFANKIPFTDGKLQFDLGVGYWDIYNLFTSRRNDLLHPFIEISYPLNVFKGVKLTPFVKFDGYNLPFETDFEEGTITSAGTKYCIMLGRKFALTGLTSFGYDDGGFGFQRGIIWKDYLNLEVTLSSHLTWRVAEAQFYVPLGVTDRDTEQVYGTGFTWTF